MLVEIVKGMAMFEAGYKTGFFDGARRDRRRRCTTARIDGGEMRV